VSFEWFVALRYLREGKVQTALILGAVSLGVAVVVFISALISGLNVRLIAKTLGAQAHIIVRPPDLEARLIIDNPSGDPSGHPAGGGAGPLIAARIEKPSQRLQSISGWPEVIAELARLPGVTAISPVVSGSAFALRGAATKSIALRGIEPTSFGRIIGLGEKMLAGRSQIVGAEALVGTELCQSFGLALGDKLRILTATGQADVFTVAGIFDLGSKDLNERMVFIPLRAGQTLFDLAGGVSSIELKVSDVFAAETIAVEAARRSGLTANSWIKENPQLLIALQSQQSSKNVILFFITLTVALGIASVLIVSVVQKSREIGVMRAVGTTRGRILRIFLIQGGLVGFAGSLLGAGLGALLAQSFVRLWRGADGSPMFPVMLSPMLFLLPAALATVVGLLAAVVPARRAARLDPAQVIRYG